jgi:hypothetical protein
MRVLENEPTFYLDAPRVAYPQLPRVTNARLIIDLIQTASGFRYLCATTRSRMPNSVN